MQIKSKTTKVQKSAAPSGKAPAKKADPFAIHKAYSRAHCQGFSKLGIGANLARCGNQILDSVVTALATSHETLTSARLSASDRVLVIQSPDWKRTGPRLFAYPVSKEGGDILEVKDVHADKPANVRVSLKALREGYAKVKGTVISLMPKAKVLALMKTENTFKPSALAFGLAK